MLEHWECKQHNVRYTNAVLMPRGGLHLERELNAVDDAVHAQSVTAVATLVLHGSTGVTAVAACYSSCKSGVTEVTRSGTPLLS